MSQLTGVLTRTRIALVVLCTAVFLCTSPGRIVFPDDEIVFQTTQSLWERGDFAIPGIPKRTGELKGRPDGTFGWAPGVDGRRYGIFGHGLSIAALPLYALGAFTADIVPWTWSHAVRSDHYFVHRRTPRGDWLRLVVSLTNPWLTAIGVVLLFEWLLLLGFSGRAALLSALAYAFGTAAWAYSRTFLSEPLSVVVLLGAAICITAYHRAQAEDGAWTGAGWLWLAGALAGLSVHVHVLNIVAIPCLLVFAWTGGRRGRHGKAVWLGASVLGTTMVVALALSQWWRFGDPFETGRYDHYSHFIVPGEGLLAMLVSPGRSLWLSSPALLVGALGWRRLFKQHRTLAWTCLSLVATRLIFVACRSDWWGGWAVGPRFLVPVIPFALVPLAMVLDAPQRRPIRLFLWLGLAASTAASALLATFSIFEWMLVVFREHGTDAYLSVSHWSPAASPYLAATKLQVDVLFVGAVRIAQHGHTGLAWLFVAVAGLAATAAVVLYRGWAGLAPASSAGHRTPHGREAGQSQGREDHPPR